MPIPRRWYPCCCVGEGYGSSGSSLPFLPGSSASSGRGSSQFVACGCCAGVAPLQVQVEVDGMHPNLPGLCGSCDDYNATYVLTWSTGLAAILTYCFPPGTSCWWSLDFPTICGRSRAHLVIGCGPAAVEVQFSLMPTDCHGAGQWLRWWKVFDATPSNFPCLFDGLEVPYATTTNDCTTAAPVRLYAV